MANNDRQGKLEALLKQTEQGIKEVFESDKYKQYLETMSKFHNYSARNCVLIVLQRPYATHVAGYNAWIKKFNRQVKKGEKGIRILGFTPKKITKEIEIKDKSGNIAFGADGKPKIEKVTKEIPSFTPVYVFDVSQTEGEPLPQLTHELDGSVNGYKELVKALKEVSPFPIIIEDIDGSSKGYCDPIDKKIAIKKGMSETQTIKTMIHEITHADLHAPEVDLEINEHTDKRTKEIEAESTAFVVCSHYNIDTSEYSFAYMASWSSSKELKELQNSLDTIQKQANNLIDRIDTRLIELHKERQVEEDKTSKRRTNENQQDLNARLMNMADKFAVTKPKKDADKEKGSTVKTKSKGRKKQNELSL